VSAPIALGVVTRPHGVRGELRVHRHNPRSTLLGELESVLLRRADGEATRVRIEGTREGPKGVLLMTLEGVSGREDAEALRGAELCVLREELPEPPEGEWYHVDLLGLRAVRPDGREAGRVVEVLAYPTVDCLRVRGEDGEWEVPMVEPWVGEVRVDEGYVEGDGLEELGA